MFKLFAIDFFVQELEAIKARVREMEEEAEKLKELQNEVEKQMNLSPPPGKSQEKRCRYKFWGEVPIHGLATLAWVYQPMVCERFSLVSLLNKI